MNFIERNRIKRGRLLISIIILSFICNEILSPVNALSQEPVAFGELKPTGSVQIQSSTGKWVDIKEVYPLLGNTKVKTQGGMVLIILREGSRIDLANDTESAINVTSGNCTVDLVQGTVSFNIAPSSSLNVGTKDADVSIAPTAGTGASISEHIRGMIFSNCHGTLIRSFSGKINVSVKELQAKILNSRENYFVSREGKEHCPVKVASEVGKNTRLYQYLITGSFFTSGGVVAYETFRGHGVHSRSSF